MWYVIYQISPYVIHHSSFIVHHSSFISHHTRDALARRRHLWRQARVTKAGATTYGEALRKPLRKALRKALTEGSAAERGSTWYNWKYTLGLEWILILLCNIVCKMYFVSHISVALGVLAVLLTDLFRTLGQNLCVGTGLRVLLESRFVASHQ